MLSAKSSRFKGMDSGVELRHQALIQVMAERIKELEGQLVRALRETKFKSSPAQRRAYKKYYLKRKAKIKTALALLENRND